MTHRLLFACLAAALLSGCTTSDGPDGLLGSVLSFGYAAPTAASLAASRRPAPAPAAATPGPLAGAAAESIDVALLAPASQAPPLADLPLRADGTPVLPPARALPVIDVSPVRAALAAGDAAAR